MAGDKKLGAAILLVACLLLYGFLTKGMIFGLLLSILVLFYINFIFTGKDIMNPGNVICLSFAFAVICALFNIERWAINIKTQTYCYIMLGLVCYSLPGIAIYSLIHPRIITDGQDSNSIRNVKLLKRLMPNRKFVVDKIFIWLIVFFDMAVLMLFALEILRISGGGDITKIMYAYRHAKEGESVSLLTNQLLRILVAFSYVSLYVFIYNIYYCKDKLKNNITLLLPVVFHLFKAFLSSGRYEFLILFIYCFSVIAFLYYLENHCTFRVNARTLRYMIVGVVALVLFFYEIREIMGRDTYDEDIITYITAYFGGSIQLFDQYLKTYDGPTSTVLGAVTFNSVYKYIIKFFHITLDLGTSGEFRRASTGILIGNVYTTFRKYLQDFGVWGLVICPIIASVVWNIFYHFTLTSGSHYSRIVYSYLLYAQVLSSYSEQFFSVYLSIDIIMIVFMIYVAYECLKHVRIKK